MSVDRSLWDENIVRALLHNNIVEKIMEIPLSSEGDPDFASWPHCKSGTYTVRSAYNLARTTKFGRIAASQGVDRQLTKLHWRRVGKAYGASNVLAR